MTSKFINKLRSMIDDSKTNINWVLDSDIQSELKGNDLIIFDHSLESQLSKYFKTNKLESFIRQLNYYGFKCPNRKNKNQKYIYYHNEFTKNGKNIQIKRKKIIKKSDNFNFDKTFQLLFQSDDQLSDDQIEDFPFDNYIENCFPVN